MKFAVLAFLLACSPRAPATQAPTTPVAPESPHGPSQTTTTTTTTATTSGTETTVAPGPPPAKAASPEPASAPPALDARCPAQSPKIGGTCRPEGLSCNYGVLYACNLGRWEARFSK